MMPTLQDIIDARRFAEAYLGRKFKDNDEFFHQVFEEWWYKTPEKPLGEFLTEWTIKKCKS